MLVRPSITSRLVMTSSIARRLGPVHHLAHRIGWLRRIVHVLEWPLVVSHAERGATRALIVAALLGATRDEPELEEVVAVRKLGLFPDVPTLVALDTHGYGSIAQ